MAYQLLGSRWAGITALSAKELVEQNPDSERGHLLRRQWWRANAPRSDRDCIRVSGGCENDDIMGVLAVEHYVVLFCGSERREHAWEINRGTQDNRLSVLRRSPSKPITCPRNDR
jgi:hypothetical protein